jgi:hypothetical protein
VTKSSDLGGEPDTGRHGDFVKLQFNVLEQGSACRPRKFRFDLLVSAVVLLADRDATKVVARSAISKDILIRVNHDLVSGEPLRYCFEHWYWRITCSGSLVEYSA